MAAAGRQAQGDDAESSSVEAFAPDEADPRGEDDTPVEAARADEAGPAAAGDTPAEPAPRRGPTVPLRLLLLVTLVNSLLAVGLLILRPPWRVERDTTVPPLPTSVAELQARVARGEHGTPYTLVLTDNDLTATARHFLAQQQDVPFEQVRLAVVDGRLEATGVTTGLAVAVPVRIVASVETRNGTPLVTVADVGIGGVALPPFVHQQVLAEANRAVDLSRYDLPVTVDVVVLRQGTLEAHGTVR